MNSLFRFSSELNFQEKSRQGMGLFCIRLQKSTEVLIKNFDDELRILWCRKIIFCFYRFMFVVNSIREIETRNGLVLHYRLQNRPKRWIKYFDDELRMWCRKPRMTKHLKQCLFVKIKHIDRWSWHLVFWNRSVRKFVVCSRKIQCSLNTLFGCFVLSHLRVFETSLDCVRKSFGEIVCWSNTFECFLSKKRGSTAFWCFLTVQFCFPTTRTILRLISLLLRLDSSHFGGRRVLSTPSCDQREQATQVQSGWGSGRFSRTLLGSRSVRPFRVFKWTV